MEEQAPEALTGALRIRIYREAVLGHDRTTVPGEEAAAYFEKIKAQVEEMRKDPKLTELIIPSDPFTEGPHVKPISQQARDREMHRTMGRFGSSGYQIIIERVPGKHLRLVVIQRREVRKLDPEGIEKLKASITHSFQPYLGSFEVDVIPYSDDLPPRK